MIRVFAGYDPREAHGFHVFLESLIRHSSQPVSITPLHGYQRDGTNAFTYERFLVPYLCGYQGTAIFLDGSDMLVRTDIAELERLADTSYAVQVVKHEYQTRHPRKYLGTVMEADNKDYPRKNWSSVVLWNCAHSKHQWIRPESIRVQPGSALHQFQWLKDDEIGALPPEWNTLIGERQTHDVPKIVHFTLGIPAFSQYRTVPYGDEWRLEQQTVLMGVGA